jgi:hypothetical protein
MMLLQMSCKDDYYMPIKSKITNIKNLVPTDKRLNDTDISGFYARIISLA